MRVSNTAVGLLLILFACAVLVRIPGTPSSAAYVGESYALTQDGRAGYVLGVDVTVAAIGGLSGAVILIMPAPMLAEVAMQFTSFGTLWSAPKM